MAKHGPIILIENDADDRELFGTTLQDLEVENQLRSFPNCMEALNYLTTTQEKPFIIFCDINMPLMTGLDFKRTIDTDPYLRKKSIPFIFYSTSAEQKDVDTAYMEMTIQGFFEKPFSYLDIRKRVKSILDYWENCRHPNS